MPVISLSALLLASLLFGTAPALKVPAPSDVPTEKVAAAQQNGSATAPVLVAQANPVYTEEARAKHISGDVELSLLIDEAGLPQDIKIIHGLGNGLDEKAMEAVKQYRFRPATRDGQPVATKIHINVNFQIF